MLTLQCQLLRAPEVDEQMSAAVDTDTNQPGLALGV